MSRIIQTLSAIALSLTLAIGQQLVVTTTSGGSVVTESLFGIKLNSNSTLSRDWVVINDLTCPIQLNRIGLRTINAESGYEFDPVGAAACTDSVVAFNLIFILYDVFGNHITTLAKARVRDFPANSTIDLSDVGWPASENEVRVYLTSVSFVSEARTASGNIWRFNPTAIEGELAKTKIRVSSGEFAPVRNK